LILGFRNPTLITTQGGISRTARSNATLLAIFGSRLLGFTARERVSQSVPCDINALYTVVAVPSRRDDLESAALMLIHLLTPRGLSWIRHGVPKTDAAHERLKRAKAKATPEDLCRGLPQEFEEFLRYCRRLKFQECPDYNRWREEFRELARQEGFPASDAFIWPPPPAREQVSPILWKNENEHWTLFATDAAHPTSHSPRETNASSPGKAE
jgi:hypothetical protein